MTDRWSALVVVLSEPMRSDDASGLVDAIAHLRGVATVTSIVSEPSAEALAIDRRDLEWRMALSDLATTGPAS